MHDQQGAVSLAPLTDSRWSIRLLLVTAAEVIINLVRPNKDAFISRCEHSANFRQTTARMDTARRYIEVLAFVALWMALGWIFHLDANSYLLIGVPLVVLFQRFVRQRPLRYLWVRDAPAFRLGLVGIVIAVLLMLAPGYDLMFVAVPKKWWGVALWLLCALAGAVFAGFAITQQRASAARRGLPSFITAMLIGTAIMATGALARHHYMGVPPSKLFLLLKQFLLYFAVTFVLEEVVFRGALDSHLYQPVTDGQQRGNSAWLSAIFVSALWGIWHLPLFPTGNAAAFAAAMPVLIIIHTLTGVPLSLCWRASGTLVLPAVAHAVIDSYRNCLE
jgi:membrane protease YdiL (CAAX protease family)